MAVTKVETQKLLAIANSLNLKVTAQTGFVRIEGEDSSKRLYIGLGKGGTSRVDISGWTHPLGTEWNKISEKAAPSKKISQGLGFEAPEATILATFQTLCMVLKETKKVEATKPAEGGTTNAPTPAEVKPAEPQVSISPAAQSLAEAHKSMEVATAAVETAQAEVAKVEDAPAVEPVKEMTAEEKELAELEELTAPTAAVA